VLPPPLAAERTVENSKSYHAYKKSPYRSLKHSTYFDVYDELFSPYVGNNITFVEIGVLGGGSLFMWREFFGPNARIIGVDLNPAARRWEAEGFEIHIGSQSDKQFLAELSGAIGPVDIVLDDGGHTYEQQIITTECLLPLIRDGGILVVEDTHTSYMNRFGPKSFTFIDYSKNMVDRINYRFSRFKRKQSEQRVWAMRFFESFVVFEINRKALERKSEITDNGGKDVGALDFRIEDDAIIGNYQKTRKSLYAGGKFPGSRRIAKILGKLAIKRSDARQRKKIEEYF
jgi:hypothetical protein